MAEPYFDRYALPCRRTTSTSFSNDGSLEIGHQPVERLLQTLEARLGDVHVDLGGAQRLVAEQLLNCAERDAILEQMGAVAMAQSVDRGVPLPRPLLARLRRYWKLDRPPSDSKYLFVPANGLAPMHATTLQKTFTAACRDIALQKHATIHTLRHSYGTHLLEHGVSLLSPPVTEGTEISGITGTQGPAR